MINARPLPRKPQPDIPSPRLSPIQRTKAMTVCIAAICTYMEEDIEDCFKWMPIEPEPYIIGISDRMVSTNRTQSELPQPKFRNTINSVMVMMSGVVSVTAKIFERTDSYISKEFMDAPQVIP